MTPPQSPSISMVQPTSIQQQQTIPVGQQVAAAVSQSNVNLPNVGKSINVNFNNSIPKIAGLPIRSTIATPTTLLAPINSILSPAPVSSVTLSTSRLNTPTMINQSSSAISTSFVMTNNQNVNKISTAHKPPNSSLLTIPSNGQYQLSSPMLISQPQISNTSANLNLRTSNLQLSSGPSSQVSLSNPISGNSLIIDPRAAHNPQSIQLGVSNSPSNVQFQILNVNSPSRPTLSVPTASVSGPGFTNILTGTNSSIQSQTKSPMPPRLVQLSANTRLAGVRPNAPAFTTQVFFQIF